MMAASNTTVSTDATKLPAVVHQTARRINGQTLPSYLHKVKEGGKISIVCGQLPGTLLCDKFMCPGINAECILTAEGEITTPKKFMESANKEKLKDWKNAIRITDTSEQIRRAFADNRLNFYNHESTCSGKCKARASNAPPSNSTPPSASLLSLPGLPVTHRDDPTHPPPTVLMGCVSSIREHTYSYLPDNGVRTPRTAVRGEGPLAHREGVLMNIKMDPDSEDPPAWQPPNLPFQGSSLPPVPAGVAPEANGMGPWFSPWSERGAAVAPEENGMAEEVAEEEEETGSPQDVEDKWHQIVESGLLPTIKAMLIARLTVLLESHSSQDSFLPESQCMEQLVGLLGCSDRVVDMLAEKKRQTDQAVSRTEMDLRALQENMEQKQREVDELKEKQQKFDRCLKTSAKRKPKPADNSSSSDNNSSNEGPRVKYCSPPKKARPTMFVKTQALVGGKGRRVSTSPKSALLPQPPACSSSGGSSRPMMSPAGMVPVSNCIVSGLAPQPSSVSNSGSMSQMTATPEVSAASSMDLCNYVCGLQMMATVAMMEKQKVMDAESLAASKARGDLPVPGGGGARKAAESKGPSPSEKSAPLPSNPRPEAPAPETKVLDFARKAAESSGSTHTSTPCPSNSQPEAPAPESTVQVVVREMMRTAEHVRARKSSKEGAAQTNGTPPAPGADNPSREAKVEESPESKATTEAPECADGAPNAKVAAPPAGYAEKPATPKRRMPSPSKARPAEKSSDTGKSLQESAASTPSKIKREASPQKSRNPSPRKCAVPAESIVPVPEEAKMAKDRSQSKPEARRAILGRTEEVKALEAKTSVRRSARRTSQPNKYNDFETH